MIGMGRTEAKSGQAAKRPMAATSGASLPRDWASNFAAAPAVVLGATRLPSSR